MQAHESPPVRASVYEVFAQTVEGGAYEHQFSVVADSADMALILARENFLRRRPIFGIWVVPRDAITANPPDDPDQLFRLPKPYRDVGAYRDLVGKWRRYQQDAITPETMI
ncbi:MAG: 1,2-phenylacetyl-CoA epoxidase subunit B [Actinomycetia bacterium]|nr:1,2-phenylacetyl-CoA epoxidase subunit B [Actinomycetes bacterium]